jgi:hypothetical protein
MGARGKPQGRRECAHPLFSVSVAAKGLNPAVSLLFATLAARKDLGERSVSEKVTERDEKIKGPETVSRGTTRARKIDA